MTLATRTSPSRTRLVWDSTVGKKAVMAVSGLVIIGYLVVHCIANVKIYFGAADFNAYGEWIRTLGDPFLHRMWFIWSARVVLLASAIAHGVCAYQLSRRDIRARPSKYVHQKERPSYATRTMRWGGVILGLFIVWHILDITTGTVHPGFQPGHPYQNVVATFSHWYGNVIYIVAMLALGLHLRHGMWSAAQTLGVSSKAVDRTLKITANGLALLLTAGFISVPVGVMTGVVS
ncbi:succinate dehydrogenase cytochrome b subunit [Streptomyces sp. NPDC002676]